MVEVQWLGAAGFRISIEKRNILIDPFLSLNKGTNNGEEFRDVEAVFLTHGNFDHSRDIPRILDHSRAVLYCSETMGRFFIKSGVPFPRIVVLKPRTRCIFNQYRVEAFQSQHLSLSPIQIGRAFLRAGWGARSFLSFLSYPCGEVLSYRFVCDSLSFHHFGSTGATDNELEVLSRFPLDLLLLPIQSHKRIVDLAFRYVEMLKPKWIIPHYYDNYFPPLSQKVDIEPFIRKVEIYFPKIEIRELSRNRATTF
jgi:L-ascorbate metabolism protein UlaG (beta-lactamase superfamily)